MPWDSRWMNVDRAPPHPSEEPRGWTTVASVRCEDQEIHLPFPTAESYQSDLNSIPSCLSPSDHGEAVTHSSLWTKPFQTCHRGYDPASTSVLTSGKRATIALVALGRSIFHPRDFFLFLFCGYAQSLPLLCLFKVKRPETRRTYLTRVWLMQSITGNIASDSACRTCLGTFTVCYL